MTLTYLSDSTDKYIKIEDPALLTYLANVLLHTGVTIEATKNCEAPIKQTLNTVDVMDNTKNFYISMGVLYVKPAFFGLPTYTDGVYSFKLRFEKSTGFTFISSCIFVDVTYKCKVAALLQNILEENECETREKTSTIAHLLHYALFNGSQCGCNCPELCEIFKALTDILNNVDPKITNDCGC